jgi:hypothetical protein
MVLSWYLSLPALTSAYTDYSRAGARVAYAALCGPFRGTSGADTYHHHIIQAALNVSKGAY